MREYDETDEYCPHCDNHYVVDAVEPHAVMGVEGDDLRLDSRMIKDDRMKFDNREKISSLQAEKLEY